MDELNAQCPKMRKMLVVRLPRSLRSFTLSTVALSTLKDGRKDGRTLYCFVGLAFGGLDS
jgi:hypothetical protein